MKLDDKDLLLQRAYANAKNYADRTYMTQPIGGGQVDVFSWARTFDEAKRMAAHLRSLDLPAGSKIAILSKNCAHFILADLAIWMAGHVSVAIYPTLDAETVQYVLEHSESKLIFVGKLDIYDEMAPGIPADLPRVCFPLAPKHAEGTPWKAILDSNEPIADEPTRDADDLAILVYTSGSTGWPKGVMHTFRTMSIATVGVHKTLDIGPGDRMLSYLPLAHVMERWIVETSSLVAGFKVFFAESLDTFVTDLQRASPTMFVSVPRLWLKFQLGVFKKMPAKKLSRLLKIPLINNVIRKKVLGGLGLAECRFAGTGSAPLPAEVIEWYQNLGLELLEAYGMTENFAYSHLSVPGKARAGYVGNTQLWVEHRISEEGEILVKSPASMIGYYKQEELTAASFTEDGFLKTGDRGELDAQGRLKITGRVKELFKTSKGKYVAPAPIENLINNDGKLELSCVFGSGRVKACAVINLAEDLRDQVSDPKVRAEVEAGLAELLKRTNEELVPHERLAFLAVAKEPWTIANGCLTPTMKIKRAKIEERYSPSLDEWYAANKPVLWQD